MTASQLDEELLFNAARHIGDGAARAQYLRDAAGGDEGLLRRVEALLAVYDAPDRLLDRPPIVGVTESCMVLGCPKVNLVPGAAVTALVARSGVSPFG